MSLRRTFIDGPHGQMHVRIADPGKHTARPPLYCIHQSPSSSVVYIPILKSMGTDRRSAAGDTPGFGESDPPSYQPEITDYANAHGAALDAVGFNGPVDVMGFFTGSRIAIALALQRPHQVRRLILLGIPIYSSEELGSEKVAYSQDLYTWDGAHLKKWWKHLQRSAPKGYPINLFVQHFAEIQRGGPDSWWGHRAAFNYDAAKHLPKLDIPVLVLCTDDPQGQKSHRAKEFVNRAKFIDLPYAGQGLMDLHTDDMVAHLRKFLDKPADA